MTPGYSFLKRTVFVKVSKGAKIRSRYNQVPHLTQDTNGKVTNSLKPTDSEIFLTKLPFYTRCKWLLHVVKLCKFIRRHIIH